MSRCAVMAAHHEWFFVHPKSFKLYVCCYHAHMIIHEISFLYTSCVVCNLTCTQRTCQKWYWIILLIWISKNEMIFKCYFSIASCSNMAKYTIFGHVLILKNALMQPSIFENLSMTVFFLSESFVHFLSESSVFDRQFHIFSKCHIDTGEKMRKNVCNLVIFTDWEILLIYPFVQCSLLDICFQTNETIMANFAKNPLWENRWTWHV